MDSSEVIKDALRRHGVEHRPAVWIATAVACGIVLTDKSIISVQHWEMLFFFSLCAAVFAKLQQSVLLFSASKTPSALDNALPFRQSGFENRVWCWSMWEALFVLIIMMSLGGMRMCSLDDQDSKLSLTSYCESDPLVARLRGTIVSEIELIESERGPRIPSWLEIDTSRFLVEVTEISDRSKWLPQSGRARIDLSGHLVHARVGDLVEILGEISTPALPGNPGQTDYREFVHRQGVEVLMSVNHPQAVRVLVPASSWSWTISRVREVLRHTIQEMFTKDLSVNSNRLALSLFLGDRSKLNNEIRDGFINSGTMHLLAISGLHVGILAGLVAFLVRLTNVSPRMLWPVIVSVVLTYAMLTNHKPPVLRATMLIVILGMGLETGRRVDGFNSLAFCALCLLFWNPQALFETGAQLSFLAVGGILWSRSVLLRYRKIDEEERLPIAEGDRWKVVLRSALKTVGKGYFVTAAIWGATLPLTIYAFQLIAPIGFLLNVILVPYACLTLWLGYLYLILGLLFPWWSGIMAIPLDAMLQGLLSITQWAQSLPMSHYYFSEIPVWWVYGFYALLALSWGIYGYRSRSAKWMIMLWVTLGIFLNSQPAERGQFRFTTLSVGHGLASVIELPTGEVILYDAGTLGDGKRAERVVEGYLRFRRIRHLDSVIVSHADHDHFSGLFGLLDHFSIGTFFIHRSFLDFEQRTVEDLLNLVASKGIPIRFLNAGETLTTRTQAEENEPLIQILHPAENFSAKTDNANSLVLSIDYAGRKLLLTGDVEKEGVQRLQEFCSQFDVVMAPHHGSASSHPQQVCDCFEPQLVIVSSGDRSTTSRVQALLGPEAMVLGTATSGAIEVVVDPLGRMQVASFRNPREPIEIPPRNTEK